MNFTEEQKNEALKRMEALSLEQEVIDNMKYNDEIYISEPILPGISGALFKIREESVFNIVSELKKRYNIFPYHIIHKFIEDKETYNILFVNTERNSWEFERYDIKECMALSCVFDVEAKNYEFKIIGLRNVSGGLDREW